MGDTFNQTGGGSNNQFQQGHGNSQIQNNSGGIADWKPPFTELAKQVEDKAWPEETPAEVVEQYATPALAVSVAMETIETELERPETDSQPDAKQVEEDTKSWGATFQSMVPLGIKLSTVALKAGRDAMKTQTVSGAIIDALLEAFLE